jgi:predicted DNA-binding WGR domain protein
LDSAARWRDHRFMQTMIELARCNPEKNMARYYRLEIECDLFGQLLARRTWGRIGRGGQSRCTPVASLEEAWAELRLWETRKRRRGYGDRP